MILILGADLLVRGAAPLAAGFGVSPLVIGSTIVAVGTVSPEIAVSLVLLQALNSSALPVLNLFAAIFAPITFVALVVFAIRSALLKKKE